MWKWLFNERNLFIVLRVAIFSALFFHFIKQILCGDGINERFTLGNESEWNDGCIENEMRIFNYFWHDANLHGSFQLKNFDLLQVHFVHTREKESERIWWHSRTSVAWEHMQSLTYILLCLFNFEFNQCLCPPARRSNATFH